MKIYETLQAIQVELKAPKSQYNEFGNYNYRKCEDILEALKPILAPLKGCVILSDELCAIGDRYYVKATATLHIDGESISVTAYAREEESKKGMDGSQITGASSSYARKYALNGLFAIDDQQDSDTTNKGTDRKKTAPMTYDEALAHVFSFGQHKGQTLKDVWQNDIQYIKWLENRDETDDQTKAAIAAVRAEIAKKKQGESA